MFHFSGLWQSENFLNWTACSPTTSTNFSPVSQPDISARVFERNSLEMKVAMTWRRFQPVLKILARFLKPGYDLQTGQTG